MCLLNKAWNETSAMPKFHLCEAGVLDLTRTCSIICGSAEPALKSSVCTERSCQESRYLVAIHLNGRLLTAAPHIYRCMYFGDCCLH